MQYKLEIEIKADRDKVVALMDDPANMPHWQRGFVAMEHLSGELGQEGSKSKLIYQLGKRNIEMIETITRRDLPAHFDAIYETGNVWNEMRNTFSTTSSGHTLWSSEVIFRFSSFGMRMMGWLMPKAFKKQSLQYMQDFKAFVEEGRSVQEQA